MKEILIQQDEDTIGVALVENQQLSEIYFEQRERRQLLGRIYKGKVENVLPGMQAAFVNIGLSKNCFLYVEDAVPKHINEYGEGLKNATDLPNISSVLKKGQEVLVQIVKEPVGTKGARVTTHITLPGRFVVLMPEVGHIGVSRRIHDEAERQRLREISQPLVKDNIGFIVRTAAEGIGPEELARDIADLTALWQEIQQRAKKVKPVSLVHHDLGIIERTVRDILSEDVTDIWTNSKTMQTEISALVQKQLPEYDGHIYLREHQDVFALYDIDTQLQKALQRKVWLKCGGYLIIDQTEALTVVDVNTGKFVGKNNLEETVVLANIEAAKEIARQLRLRNIGGIIIIDFIDMDTYSDKEEVVAVLEQELRKDRTRTSILGFTQLGLLEMTRKKASMGLTGLMERECPFCEGKGKVVHENIVCQRVHKEVGQIIGEANGSGILIEVNPAVASYLIGPSGQNLAAWQQELDKKIVVKGAAGQKMEDILVRAYYDDENQEQTVAPVHVGEKLYVKILEPNEENPNDGVVRIYGFVVVVTDGAKYVGQKKWIEIDNAFKTHCFAHIIEK
ncbi:MAG: Rne/Rng family ribonuclease [Peptococcaceae bacterium]|nr:Rne/Rng family ribonuclease [Peptococcaceae bacterium]